ncbi:MAG: hypothetical protein ROR55_19775 [Devosia sp.]
MTSSADLVERQGAPVPAVDRPVSFRETHRHFVVYVEHALAVTDVDIINGLLAEMRMAGGYIPYSEERLLQLTGHKEDDMLWSLFMYNFRLIFRVADGWMTSDLVDSPMSGVYQ